MTPEEKKDCEAMRRKTKPIVDSILKTFAKAELDLETVCNIVFSLLKSVILNLDFPKEATIAIINDIYRTKEAEDE